jgi:hypothetical protein
MGMSDRKKDSRLWQRLLVFEVIMSEKLTDHGLTD